MAGFDLTDAVAAGLFILGWAAYDWLTLHSRFATRGLNGAMNDQRRAWMGVLLRRDLRMIDTAIMAGLQQGTAFFASACIFAIGGCFALLGSSDRIAAIAAELPFHRDLQRTLVEAKLLGLVVLFAYAFFKFGWAYRLFNYCTILIGAIPMSADAARDPPAAQAAVARATAMNQLAARHFNAGLRGIFFSIAYLGWFLGPSVLMVTTVLVIVILARRQFLSPARDIVVDADNRGAAP